MPEAAGSFEIRESSDHERPIKGGEGHVVWGGAGPGFDLDERTALFGEAVIGFAKKVARGPITDSLIKQLVRAGTSIGANYCEADDAESKKDFGTRSGSAERNLAKRATGSAWWLPRNPSWPKPHESYGRKRES